MATLDEAHLRTRIYSDRREEAAGSLDRLRSRSQLISGLRLVTFALLVGTGWFALAGGDMSPIWGAVLALLILFLVLVRIHGRVRDRMARADATVLLQQRRIAAARREWSALPNGKATRDDLPHWAEELDVAGDASLLRLLSGGLTVVGRHTLESWLLVPANPDEIVRRQSAVRELSSDINRLDAIQTEAILAPPWKESAFRPFLEWAESAGAAGPKQRAPIMAARVVTVALVAIVLMYGSGLVDARWLVAAFGLSVVANLALERRARANIDAAQGREGPIESFSNIIQLLEGAEFQSDKLKEMQQSLRDQDALASAALLSLRRTIALAEVKYSPLLHVALQLALLWDVHIAERLEKWRREHGRHVRRWLFSLGEVEAMASLATLAHANPDWCYPEVTAAGGPGVVSGVDVAHPLIAREVRVGNDVSVGPRGTFLLVTGSNMSGKSTLLRTIGLNTVLAQAGAPVCARSFQMPSVVLATSVQVQDSLAQGVSRFMAELLRLREVVELVRALQGDDAPLPLYLLDEILQGTNTAERQVGARMVVRQLLSLRCIGVVTTHDLALADSPDLDSAARKVHFTEGVEEQHGQVVLSFEYKLKPGIATSVNALKLMKAVGLAE